MSFYYGYITQNSLPNFGQFAVLIEFPPLPNWLPVNGTVKLEIINNSSIQGCK